MNELDKVMTALLREFGPARVNAAIVAGCYVLAAQNDYPESHRWETVAARATGFASVFGTNLVEQTSVTECPYCKAGILANGVTCGLCDGKGNFVQTDRK